MYEKREKKKRKKKKIEHKNENTKFRGEKGLKRGDKTKRFATTLCSSITTIIIFIRAFWD